jgi:hypothetical protein
LFTWLRDGLDLRRERRLRSQLTQRLASSLAEEVPGARLLSGDEAARAWDCLGLEGEHPMTLGPGAWPNDVRTWSQRGTWTHGGALPAELLALPWTPLARVLFLATRARALQVPWAQLCAHLDAFLQVDDEGPLVVCPGRVEVVQFGPSGVLLVGARDFIA